MTKKPLEKTLYPLVAGWVERKFECFQVVINEGLRYSRIDVLGIRDVGGDLSGDVESIAVEVKRGSTPFTNAAGQAVGYKVYANRVYLADSRDKPFDRDEIAIASNLGIGLIWIKGKRCQEVLTSPMYQPIPKLQLHLFRNLHIGKCQMCGTFFDLGKNLSRVADGDMSKAIKKEKGLLFVLDELEKRKVQVGLQKERIVYYRNWRFICPDCVSNVLAPLG